MRGWILGTAAVIAVIAVMAWPSADAEAHYGARHYAPARISVGFSYGYPFYRPFYPGTAIGIGINLTPRPGPPKQHDRQSRTATKQLFVYPAEGQSEDQMSEDRYQCHVWASGETGFDPTLGAGTADEADEYGRAFSACMEGRGYVVK